MKQNIKQILRNMIKKRNDQLNERSGASPKHIQEESNDKNEFSLKQDTFWK
jgi:hypothetical protein